MPEHRDSSPIADRLLTPALRGLALRQCGLLSTRQLRDGGLAKSTVYRLAGGRWRRPVPGVIDFGDLAVEQLGLGVRARRAVVLALLALGPQAVAVGLSALILLGVWGVPSGTAPMVALPAGAYRSHRSGIRVRRFHPGDRVQTVDGFRTAEPTLALAQAIVEVSPRVALALLDSALNRGVIGTDQLSRVRELARGRRGARRIVSIWGMVDGRRESPLESLACFDLTLVGLPPTSVQVVVRDADGQFLARGDLGYELDDGRWLLIELLGREFHEGWDRVKADGQRLNQMALTGKVSVLTYSASDLGADGQMVRDVRRFLEGHTWRAAGSVSPSAV